MTQLTFLDGPAPPHNSTPTSIAAAESIASNSTTSREAGDRIESKSRTQADEMRLLEWLHERGELGATDHEIQWQFGWAGDYERPRRWRLEKDGDIRWSGDRRKTGSVPCKVWVAK